MKPQSKNKHDDTDSSSDSDAPLVEIHSSFPSNSLFKSSIEKCEFCDKLCNNKYNMLVHNATHIIIPLLNQKLHNCSQCQRLFTSVESLEWHSINSHSYISDKKDYLPKILQSMVKREPIMILKKEPLFEKVSNNANNASDTQITNGEINLPEILKSIVQNQPVTVLTKLSHPDITRNENILQSFVKKEPIMLLKKESFKIENDEIDDSITIVDSEDCDDIKAATVEVESDNESSKNPRIKDRIRFEDDDDDIFNHNDLDVSKTDIANLNSVEKNTIILGNKPNMWGQIETVHNDELKNPGLFRCKKCSKMFPNRFEAIIHETTHLKFKRRHPFLCCHCDWYVATSPTALLYHKKHKHPDKDNLRNKKHTRKCDKCGLLYYRWPRHEQNYHSYFNINELSSDSEDGDGNMHEEAEEVVAEKVCTDTNMWMIKTVKVCEFCYQWFRDRQNIKYQIVKDYYKIGERSPCERCDKLFFELKIVRVRIKKREQSVHRDIWRSKKPVTNSDRLKNVQQRLKKLKLLNKF